jgi:hypothetical protein
MTDIVQVRPSDPMTLIAAGVQGGMSPDQLGKLMELQERHDRNRSAEAFAAALTEFQRRCPSIFKCRKTTDGKAYASFDDVMRVIAPHLAAVGLCVSFDVEHAADAGSLNIVTILRHGTHEHRTRFSCPVPAEMRVNATQKMGAALSYAKRYGLCAALNLVVTDEDSDGSGLGDGPAPTITEEQAITLRDMVEASGSDMVKFLKWAKVSSLEEMPAAFYPTAHSTLKGRMEGKR